MTSLEKARAEIQKIDKEIVALIAKRTNMADSILRGKREVDISINDDEQNKIVLSRAVDYATEKNLDAGAVRRIFEILIEMNIARQHELHGEGNLP
ncbi:MAG TPA: chorismate mutase [Methanosarcinales archaeon]|nr:chorismate mutase [Methanosarcinales archaeon]